MASGLGAAMARGMGPGSARANGPGLGSGSPSDADRKWITSRSTTGPTNYKGKKITKGERYVYKYITIIVSLEFTHNQRYSQYKKTANDLNCKSFMISL
jgi:hypothetical protein